MKRVIILLQIMALVVFSVAGQNVTYSSELLQKAQAGDAQAMADLGWCYAEGKGISTDFVKAIELYNKAIDKGNVDAIRRLGTLYCIGKGVQDYSKAIEWYKKAADLGDAGAMFNLGIMYDNGHGVQQDYSKAIEWYKKAAGSGQVDAMFNLGNMYSDGRGTAQDYSKAIEWYKKAADLGDAGAMFNLGIMYDNGHGVQQDYSKAFEWYQKAADLGDADAMNNLGVMYNHGKGTAKDDTKAFEWFKKAADLGDADAMNNLGVMYNHGQGTAKDDTKAIEWYKKAADLGDAGAMLNLGGMFYNGQGVQQDYSKAMEWFRKAADLGDAGAMLNLGIMFANGEGVTKDINTALDWFVKRMMVIDDNVCDAIGSFQYVLRTENQKGEYNSKLRSYKELFNLYKNAEESEKASMDIYYGLALFYAVGIGTERNKIKAEEYIEEQLMASHSAHRCGAAEFYEFGLFGSVDYKKALEIYELFFPDPYLPAKAASFYIEGKGTTKNISRALELINQSIDMAKEFGMTSPFADYLLGKLYFEGNGVKQNRAEAFKLFKVAAEDEEDPDDEAMNMLSTCYRFGFGTTKDLNKAEYWLKKAQETGNEKAKRLYLLSITKEN